MGVDGLGLLEDIFLFDDYKFVGCLEFLQSLVVFLVADKHVCKSGVSGAVLVPHEPL